MKRNIAMAVLLAWVILCVLFINSARSTAQGPQGDELRIQQGMSIAPVPLNTEGKDAALVGLGSYFVNAPGGCTGCHTNPTYAGGGNPFLRQPERINVERYLAGGARFGPFISRNLTPDPRTGLPAGLTFEEFQRTMRTGEDIKKLPPPVPSPANDTLQVMPWPEYTKMTDRDIRAIYEYLRAIPARPGYPQTPIITAISLSTASPGDTITVSWSGPSARPATDWIGLYAVGAADTDANIIGGGAGWRYTGGAASGSVTFTMPNTPPGQYEFRYFLEDVFIRVDQNGPVTVR